MEFNAQTLLEAAGVAIEQEIPLPYGLAIKISMADGIEKLCATPNEVQALQGLMGVCQGILLTLTELQIPLIHMVLVANKYLGVIVSTKAGDLVGEVIEKLGLSCIEDLIDLALEEVLDMIDSTVPGLTVQYIEFCEMETLWYKIVNSKMIYILQREYQSTNYSMMNGLDRLLNLL